MKTLEKNINDRADMGSGETSDNVEDDGGTQTPRKLQIQSGAEEVL